MIYIEFDICYFGNGNNVPLLEQTMKSSGNTSGFYGSMYCFCIALFFHFIIEKGQKDKQQSRKHTHNIFPNRSYLKTFK